MADTTELIPSTDVLKTHIRRMILELGFERVGFASVDRLGAETALLTEWLNQGHHGDMGYMARNTEKREDIEHLVPGARTVIVVAMNYNTEHVHLPSTQQGKISRYAWGDDYHDMMLERLREAERRILDLAPDTTSRSFVDTAPVMEKPWAVRAGIGWQAKNTNVIAPQLGSYFFLGEIVTSLALSADPVLPDRCGTCTACLDACPTSAFDAAYRLNASRCISYWTIEYKGTDLFPNDIREHLDGWLYGCDVCQEVCPWNRFSKKSNEAAFQPRFNQTALNLDEVLAMDDEEFRVRFKGSAMKRTKLQGLQRNARNLKEYYAFVDNHNQRED